MAYKRHGATVTCQTAFEILPVDFQHRANPFRAHIFLCLYYGAIDGETYAFRKCYARGCPNNLCPHVSQAVLIANRYLQRDYHRLESAGIEIEKSFFTLADMLVQFEQSSEDGSAGLDPARPRGSRRRRPGRAGGARAVVHAGRGTFRPPETGPDLSHGRICGHGGRCRLSLRALFCLLSHGWRRRRSKPGGGDCRRAHRAAVRRIRSGRHRLRAAVFSRCLRSMANRLHLSTGFPGMTNPKSRHGKATTTVTRSKKTVNQGQSDRQRDKITVTPDLIRGPCQKAKTEPGKKIRIRDKSILGEHLTEPSQGDDRCTPPSRSRSQRSCASSDPAKRFLSSGVTTVPGNAIPAARTKPRPWPNG